MPRAKRLPAEISPHTPLIRQWQPLEWLASTAKDHLCDNRAKVKMQTHLIQGDLLDQDVDVIVNAWNRNIIPWWLLLPQGVSGAIKRRGGTGPFKELAKHGSIPLGGAVLTSTGKLPFKAIIHVAGINMLWRASEWSIRESVRNTMALAHERGFQSIAFPLFGAGSGGFNQERAKAIMEDALGKLEYPMEVRVVVYRPL
jgi:O-acetyl-ADP-ribose deacetylase (regulator of RNase III)